MDAAVCNRRLEWKPEFKTADLEESVNHISALLTGHDLQVVGNRQDLDVTVRHASVGKVDLVYFSYGTEVSISPNPLGDFYALQIPLAGTANVAVDGQVRTYVPGTACLFSPSVSIDMALNRDCEHLDIRLDERLFKRAFERLFDDYMPQSLTFEPFIEFGVARHEMINNIVSYLVSSIYSDCGIIKSESYQKNLEELLVNTLIFGVTHNHFTRVPAGSRAPQPAYVKRARAFIHDNFKDAITPGQIAKAAGISVRSIYQGFNSHYGKSPMAYLRDVRLDAAHKVLTGDAPHKVKVTDVAMECGFSHLGHFASAYRDRFGEHPRETLLRA